ncbi:unnamed protein product [Bursaphelenchus okinawaensis]|uniref:ATP-dependent RNA helicase n=1 Tax=Bursaphelenchus okinawaensis TaxID=465554 RepID=A0A811JW15_9BILA|nr:unnamed protein product [Bursaphelenchus okinawaensis]CAG9085910.1 unnamed protein product [Bursaphelenchus okinawaensis]
MVINVSDELQFDFDCYPEWDNISDGNLSDAPEDEQTVEQKEEPSFKVLGAHLFKDIAKLTSVPKWAENAVEFDGKISKRKGDGIEQFPGLHDKLFEAVSRQISLWFPVQKSVLPSLLIDNIRSSLLPTSDIAISAPTGSGKTLCYLLPILNSFAVSQPLPSSNKIFALVLAPVRNLVIQIENEFSKLNVFDAKILALHSKLSFEEEKRVLFPNDAASAQVNVVISTPERLVKHILDQDNGRFNFSQLRYLVVDEADGMFMPRESFLQLIENMANYPKTHTMSYKALTDLTKNTRLQKILVSATLSLEADKLHDWNLRCPKLYRASVNKVKHVKAAVKEEEDVVGDDGQEEKMEIDGEDGDNEDVTKFMLPQRLKQEVRICKPEFKPLIIYKYLKDNPTWKRVLVFVNTTVNSQRLKILLEHLCGNDMRIAEISSNVYGRRRFRLLKAFKEGNINVVISAGSLGRGLDIPGIDCVMNYDVPNNSQLYIHRAGRTARAGKKGTVVTLVSKEQKLKLKKYLLEVGIWDPESETRENDQQFIDEFKEQYQKALDTLKKQLEAVGKA